MSSISSFLRVSFLLALFLIASLGLAACADNPTAAPSNGQNPSNAGNGSTTPGITTGTGSGIVAQAVPGGQPLPTPTPPVILERKILTIWTGGWKGNAAYENFLNSIIDTYRSRNKQMTVDWQDWGSDLPARYQEAMTKLANLTPPDIVLFDQGDLYQFGAAGYLADMSELGGSVIKDDYSTAAFEALRYGSVYYGLPWMASTPVALINKKLWVQATLDPAKPPRTFAELDQAIPLMAKKTTGNVIPCWIKPNPLADFMMEDAPVFNISGDGKTRQPAFPSAATLTRWQYYKDKLYKQQGVIDKGALTDSYADALKKYQAGNLVMVLDGGPLLPALKNASADLYNNTLVVPVPLGKSGLVPLSIQGWAISKASRQPGEALTFLKTLNNADNQLIFAKLSSLTLPTQKKALSDNYLHSLDDPLSQARSLMADSLEKSRAPEQSLPAPLDPAKHQKLLEALNQGQTAIWNNPNTTPQTALTDAAKIWSDILK